MLNKIENLFNLLFSAIQTTEKSGLKESWLVEEAKDSLEMEVRGYEIVFKSTHVQDWNQF